MENKVILFQGDSITDCGRDKETMLHNGRGYAYLVQAQLGFTEPLKYTFYNRGISAKSVICAGQLPSGSPINTALCLCRCRRFLIRPAKALPLHIG